MNETTIKEESKKLANLAKDPHTIYVIVERTRERPSASNFRCKVQASQYQLAALRFIVETKQLLDRWEE